MTGHWTISHHSLVPAYNNRNQSAQIFLSRLSLTYSNGWTPRRAAQPRWRRWNFYCLFLLRDAANLHFLFISRSSPFASNKRPKRDSADSALRFFLSFFVVARLTLATRPPPLEDASAGRDQRLDTGLLTKYLCLLVQTLNWFHIMARPQHRNEVGAPWLKSNSS